MPDFKYQRDTQRMFCLGLDLNRPVDSLKELKWTRLKNVRTYQIGRIEPRPGLTLLGTVDGPVHSIRRLNVPRTGAWTRFIGSSDNLSMGQSSFTEIDDSYSGDPLALVPYRPPQSPDPWMYVMDSDKQRKVDVDGNIHFVGLPPPTAIPTVTRLEPAFKSFFGPVMDITGWLCAPSFVATFPLTNLRVDTTIAAIFYDDETANTGWCVIQPTVGAGVVEGMDLSCGAAGDTETVLVHSVSPGSNNNGTNILDIQFVSGTDGECAMVLDIPFNGVSAQGLLFNLTRGGYARIKAVVDGPDDTWSLICITSAGSGWIAGDVVFSPTSFRTYTTSTRAIGNDLDSVGLQFHMEEADDVTKPHTGYITSPLISPAIDLSMITDEVASSDDDYIYVSMAFDNIDNFADGRIMFSSSDDAVNPFDSNYFYKTFAPQDLVSIGRLKANPQTGAYSNLTPTHFNQDGTPILDPSFISGTGGTQPNQGYTDIYGPQSDLVNYNATNLIRTIESSRLGASWGLLRFRLGDLNRIGNPDLSNIQRVRVEATVIAGTDDNPDPQFYVYFGSFILTGGFGLDVDTGPDLLYRYRARCSSTGVVSNWSPPTRESFYVRRERLQLVAPAQYTLADEADKIDFQRRGGALPDSWYYIGSVDNDATPVEFIDRYPDDVIIANPAEDQIHYQLWPVLGSPVSGQTTSVCGTVVEAGSGFSTVWAPQTQIEINGIFYTIYRVNSATQLELYENAGSQDDVEWIVHEPVLQAQTMPCFWGPLGNTLFACGDPVNPQRLYWTNLGSGDDTRLSNWTDITSPSEPLMNGVIYNGRCYAWSSERFFQIIPERQDSNGNATSWTYVEIPNGKGLFGRWSFTGVQTPPGFVLYWLGREGIYATDGGAPSSITDEDLRPLFPNEGNLGEEVNGVKPPNIVPVAAGQHRLAYIDDYLYYDYATTAYTPPVPATGGSSGSGLSLTDGMPTPVDSVAVSGGAAGLALSVGLLDARPTIYDSIGPMLTTKGGSIGTSSLNGWADVLGVTLTP